MEQIGTTKPQSDILSRIGLDKSTADMHHTQDSDEPLIGTPSGEEETPAWSFGALCELIPARIRVPNLDCVEYDGKREFNIYYTYGALRVEKHDESKRYNTYSARYKRFHEEYEIGGVLMPGSFTTDKKEEINRYKGTFQAFGFFGVIYHLVHELVEKGYIKTERNKNYKLFLTYVSFISEKKDHMVFSTFTDNKEDLEAKWQERIGDDVEWFHIEECKDFNFGRPEPHAYLIP